MGIHIFFVLHIHTIPLPDLSCAAAASKVRACSEEGEQQRQICLSMPVPSTLCPFSQGWGWGGGYSFEALQSLRPMLKQ